MEETAVELVNVRHHAIESRMRGEPVRELEAIVANRLILDLEEKEEDEEEEEKEEDEEKEEKEEKEKKEKNEEEVPPGGAGEEGKGRETFQCCD